jgi:hypothetical protein
MEKIAQRMFAEFARNLEAAMAAGGAGAPAPAPAAAPGAARPAAPGAARPAAPAPAPELDALRLFARPLAGKLLPALIGFGYGYLVAKLRERR